MYAEVIKDEKVGTLDPFQFGEKKKNAGNQVIFSVLRWKSVLPCDPPGSRIMKCGEIFIKYCDRYNKLILCYIIAE